ncbi:UDP-N-acetylmuramoyl-L-alanyl-D-glutamate--2,6-diaminopimelate ligase [Spirochaeta africana]|uniref:UDP-N-acetylmuramyl-tripeptide synthetase n=1 Tax=Spirochaeta africana (strain ATCC 700263 / DSM 8902 / Z-7692) TaxID=889378 RepID=H9UJS9_SPIAZ|nr:UDP-N-acetylmuramoyl-L-alanyl-D-glutamate--2,6-diaminopimelate ligase [Spirochaeta africana]AFG37772.1 UDP-N-acetylmuramyl-tripeptide synthetase [Spirochaeta africana DSM 8902]
MPILDTTEFNPGTAVLAVQGPERIEVTSITQDSRRCGPAACFTAISGLHSDGHRFIPDCIAAGASLIVHEQELDPAILNQATGTTFLRVTDSRRAFSALAAWLYDTPESPLQVIGITGTDGKSTTVSLLHQLLQACGCRSGFLSTVAMHDGLQESKNSLRQSTPEADEIHQRLARMRDNHCRYAVVEATSHGLSPKTARLADVSFTAGVFTNITHEHLEFHGTFEQYRHDKAELFRRATQASVLNADDPNSHWIAQESGAPVRWYSLNPADQSAIQLDMWAEQIEATPAGSNFLLCTPEARLPAHTSLIGEINVANILAASLAAHSTAGIPLQQIAAAIAGLQGPRGRMMRIDHGQPFSLFVDYAHTPGSFGKLLPMLKNLAAQRMIVVFGSAGNRDTAKRPMQGEIADRFADIIVLTDEDPREEDSMAILEDIADGITAKTRGESLFLIPDRRTAIEHACRLAGPGDLVVTLGKGHEGNIQYARESIEWDEPEVASRILSGLGYFS